MPHLTHPGLTTSDYKLSTKPLTIPAAHVDFSYIRDLRLQFAERIFASLNSAACSVFEQARAILDTEHVLTCLKRPHTGTLISVCADGVFKDALPESGLFVGAASNGWLDKSLSHFNLPSRVRPVYAPFRIDGLDAGCLVVDSAALPHIPPEQIESLLSELTELGSVALTQAHLREQLAQVEAQQAQFNDRTNELQMLLNITNSLSTTFNLDELFKIFVDQLRLAIPFDSAAIFIFDQREHMRVMAYEGPATDLVHLGAQWPLSHHFKLVVEARKPFIIPDTRANTSDARTWHDQIRTHLAGRSSSHIITWMGVPIMAHDEVIGILTLDRAIPNGYSDSQATLTLAVAQQAGLAIDNAWLHSQKLEAVALSERNRLSRDLHDSVSQAVYSMSLGVRTMEALARTDISRVLEPLPHVVSMAEAALSEMRALIYELRPELLEIEGLLAAIKKQIVSIETRHSLKVSVTLPTVEPAIGIEAKEMIYRTLVEALHNTVKHAHAAHVSITLTHEAHMLKLTIRDDGVGFDANKVPTQHFGLRLMNERISQIGGSLTLSSAHNAGTQIAIEVPLQTKHAVR
jgi:signal transduction histidine kinase